MVMTEFRQWERFMCVKIIVSVFIIAMLMVEDVSQNMSITNTWYDLCHSKVESVQ